MCILVTTVTTSGSIPTSHVLVRVQYPDWAQPDCCGGVNIFPTFNNASYGILFWKWPKKDIFWQLIRNMTSGGPSWQSGPISQNSPTKYSKATVQLDHRHHIVGQTYNIFQM